MTSSPRYCPQCGKECDYSLNFCPSCGRMLTQALTFDPAPAVQQGTTNNPYAWNVERPSMNGDQARMGPLPAGQYFPAENAKDPRKAIIFAAVLGFLGFMGIGHLYMGKVLKGIALLFVGGFFAMLSLVTILDIFEPSEYSITVQVFTAAVFTAPYLLLQIWQIFDAPRPKKVKGGGMSER